MALGKANSLTHLFSRFQQTSEWKTLTQGQKKFFERFFMGGNVFITGSAGVGKSFCVKVLYDFLAVNGVTMCKTSSTGVSAFNIGGQTLHSWAGIGLGEEEVGVLIAKINKNRKAAARLESVKVLLIDEVSMIKGELLDKLDIILKYFRRSSMPFGGVKLLLSGDLLQLPPVWKNDAVKTYVFESRSWREAKIEVCALTEIVRQDNNSDFAKLLNELRFGDITNIALLKSRVGAPIPKDLKPVMIYCKNVDVDRINNAKLAEIKEESFFFRARDMGGPHYTEIFNKNCPAAELIELKKGAQVMLLSNLDVEAGFVNGSIGVVECFTTEGVEVKFKHGSTVVSNVEWQIKEQQKGLDGDLKYRTVATRNQIPLRIAYALTVHKCQSATLDCAYIDLNEAFGTGIVYSALSRVRSLDSLYLEDFCPSRIRVDDKCAEFYQKLTK